MQPYRDSLIEAVKKKMGRPAVSPPDRIVQVSIGVPASMLDEMLEEADLNGAKNSTFLRPVLEEGWRLYKELGQYEFAERMKARRRKETKRLPGRPQ